MISVIDMPPPEESMWWRGKRGFDVGFFPSECVRIIGDKVPAHLSLPNTTPVVVVGSHSGSGKTQHLLNQSGCSGGSGGSSAEHLPTKPVLRKHGKLISFFRQATIITFLNPRRPSPGEIQPSHSRRSFTQYIAHMTSIFKSKRSYITYAEKEWNRGLTQTYGIGLLLVGSEGT